jgi:hypothetical protein
MLSAEMETVMSSAMPAGLASRPVDLVHLARYTGGDAALNAEILRLFQGQVGEMVTRLKDVIDHADQKAWHDINHSIKGAARGIGAFALADAAAAAEVLDPAADPAKAHGALHALNSNATAVELFIETYLGG